MAFSGYTKQAKINQIKISHWLFSQHQNKRFWGINEVQKASKEHSSSPKAFVTLVQHSCYNLFSVMLTIFSGH